MTKCLHLTHTHIEADSRILKEMGALAAAGYEVSGIGVVLDEGSKKSTVPFKAEIMAIRLQSRKMRFLPRTLRHVVSLCELAAKILPRAIRQRPDLVHCHDTLALVLGVIVKLFTQSRLVYDAHELESDRNGLTKLQSWLTLNVERLLWGFVDALIVVSPSIDAWYQDKVGSKSSTIILNSPLISKETLCESDYLRRIFLIPSDQKIFIYVGILGPGRGIDLVTQAFIHPAITSHLVFLGYGDWAEELKRLSANHPNIHVHHSVPHSEVVPIVKSADFGLCLVENVSLSDYYCLPNKLFEYTFASVPVLASDFPDIKTVLQTYGVGESCSLDVEAIRKAIQELSKNGKTFDFADLSPLSWQAQELKLQDLYRSLFCNSSF